MNEEALNLSIRKFLKMVGIRSQREIEQAVQKALAAGRLRGNESLPASVRLSVPELGLDVVLEGKVELE
ncbi:MAG: DUF6494 family protein [Pseudomonadota bacterium]